MGWTRLRIRRILEPAPASRLLGLQAAAEPRSRPAGTPARGQGRVRVALIAALAAPAQTKRTPCGQHLT